MKNLIQEMLNEKAFGETFTKLYENSSLVKRYSIMKCDYPYHYGNNIYKTTFCFFFYSKGWLIESFYCELTGKGKQLEQPQINCYKHPCNDVNRSDDWEWVEIAA